MKDKNPAVAPAAVKEVDHKSRGHAPYSGSKIGYLEKCIGYESDQTGDKSAADSGTRVHEAVETGDFSKLDKWEKEMAEYCIAYRTHLTKPGTTRVDEYEIEFSSYKQWSYVDCLLINGTHGDLMDWKTSQYETEAAETNRQGHAYAVGTFKKYPELQTITIHFVMCKLGKIDAATFTREQALGQLEPQLNKIIDTVKAGQMPKIEGKWCDWCGKKATCEALNNKAALVIAKYEGLPIPTEVHSSAITDPKDMSKALALATLMDKWASSVKKHALDLYLSGVEIPGYELAERKGTRSVTDAQAAYATVKDVVPVEEFLKCVKVSAPSLEDVYTSFAPKGKKTQWKQKLEDALAEAGILEQGEPTKYLRASKSK